MTGPGALPASSSVSTHAAKVTTHVARAHAVKTAAKKTTVSSQAAQAATAGAKGFLVEYEDSISKALHIPAGTVLPLTGAAIVGVIVLAATNKK